MRLTLLFLLCASLHAAAQSYPARPVKLVVPFPAGSATDQVARLAGAQMQEALGQPFIVENKAGAQGGIAAAEVAKAAADGYTLMVTTNTPQAANVSLFKKLNYDPIKDFTPITRYGTTAFVLMVRPDFPAKDLKAFISHAKANAGKLSGGYGSSGSQVSLAMLKQLGKLDIVEVPYKGIPQTVTDTMGGSLQLTFVDLANALAQELPAIAEELPGYEVIAWFGLVAPAKLPAPIVQRLNDVTMKSLANPQTREKFAQIGVDIAALAPAEFGRFIQAEVANWARLVKLAGIQPE
jgi:tripartite-type tricarboxylate transporter receptor subunit TctC